MKSFQGCAVLVLLLAGCHGPHRRDAVLEAFRATGAKDMQPDNATKEQMKKPLSEAAKEIQEWRKKYDEGAGMPDQQRRYRDAICYSMLTLTTHYHEGTTDDLYELASGLDSMFDLAGLTLGGVGAVTVGVAYNAASAFLTGFRGSLGKNILAEQTKYAIMIQMEALRDKQEAEIRTKLVERDVRAYPLDLALLDLYDFFKAGSLKQAVTQLVRAVEDAKKASEEQLRNAKVNEANRK